MERSERLITSVSEKEKKAIRLQAAMEDKTMSEFLRQAALEKLERDATDTTISEIIGGQ